MLFKGSDVFLGPHSFAAKETPLINRVKELELLKETADRAISDQGGLVFLYGEAGIGKTRLTKELRAYARSRGMQILSGRCPALFRMNGVPPYSPWKEVIRDYLQKSTPEQLQRAVGFYPSEIYKIVPEIQQKLVTFPKSSPLSPEMERDRLFEAVTQFINNISRTTPLLVVLDDLQWADSASLLLLHYLARGIYSENLLIVGAYRDTEITEKHTLSDVLAELNRARLLKSAQLRRMSSDEVAEMIRQILEQSYVPSDFCDLVYEKTNGNPFFVEEVIESLKEEGTIVYEARKFKIGKVSAIEFPKTVKDVLKSRLSRLDEESLNVLTMASFIGNDFAFDALREVTDLEESRLLEIVEKLLKTGLLKCRTVHGEDTCAFADVLIRDVLYEEVNPLRRKRLHGVIGCALEKAYSKKIGEHFGELASHFLESGNKDKALDYFLKAGEQAKKVYANNEASSYYQSALRLLEEKGEDSQERARILETLGDIEALMGEYAASLRLWDEASDLWGRLREKEKTARVSRKAAYALWVKTGDLEKAKGYFGKARELLEALPESSGLASLYADMAEMHWRSMEIDKAAALIGTALELARKLNANEILAHSLLVLAKIVSMKDRKKAGECSEEALEISLKDGYVGTAVEAYSSLANPYFGAASKESRWQFAEKGYELAKKVGMVSAQSFIGALLSNMYFAKDETDAALLLNEESVALDRKTGNLHLLPLSLTMLGTKYLVLGELEKSEGCLNEALMIARKTKDVPATMQASFHLARLLIEKGEYQKGRRLAQEIYPEKVGESFFPISILSLVSGASIELGELEEAKNYIKKAQELAQETHRARGIYIVEALWAKLFLAQKKWQMSIEYFERSLKHMPQEARVDPQVLWESAKVYIERSQEGDKRKALGILNQTLEIFEKRHAKRNVEKVKAQIAYLQTGRPVPLEPESPIVTGYAILDKLLGGGLSPTSSVALASPACDERDTLVRAFLETGAENSEPTIYMTLDPTFAEYLAEAFPSNFYLLVCNPQAENIVKSAPNVSLLKGVESLTNISIALSSIFRRLDPIPKKPRRICIGVISDALLQHGAVQTRKWLTEILMQLKAKDFTTLAVIDPLMHSPEQLHAVLGLFDGEVNIREAETDRGTARFLRVKRMSNVKHLKNEIRLTDE